MTWLVDTNVVIRFYARTDPNHALVRAAVMKLLRQSNRLQSSSQNLVECWNVLTRPRINNGFGVSIVQADAILNKAERLFPVLDDSAAVYRAWRRLVFKFNVQGAQVHDARLAAIMLVHGITNILTFNTKDFVRFAAENIGAVHPASV